MNNFFRFFQVRTLFYIFNLWTILAFGRVHAFPPLAIAGGGNAIDIYASLISKNGEITKLVFTPSAGNANNVAINKFGMGLISFDSFSVYPYKVVQVLPTGQIRPITQGTPSVDPSTLSVETIAINDYGVGLVGGSTLFFSQIPYAAIISPQGVATRLRGDLDLFQEGRVLSSAINNSGLGLIGGQNTDLGGPALVATISPSGNVTKITGEIPVQTSVINSVAINKYGAGVIGGFDNTTFLYAALVSSSGSATKLLGIPATGVLNSVAINSSGAGVIGGQYSPSDAYAAVFTPNGLVTSLSGPAIPPAGVGSINSVAINDSGNGIIGGSVNLLPYFALVSPTGVTSVITGDLPTGDGEISSVAINKADIAIAGGNHEGGTSGYLALIAPNGTATQLSIDPPDAYIESVAISDGILDFVTPKTFGPGQNFANAVFALSTQIIPNHTMMQVHRCTNPCVDSCDCSSNQRLDNYFGSQSNASVMSLRSRVVERRGYGMCYEEDYEPVQQEYAPTFYSPVVNCAQSMVWAAPFGSYLHQGAHDDYPYIDNWIGGGMVGIDYTGCRNTLYGASVAYAYSHISYGEGQGFTSYNQELLSLYASKIYNCFVLQTSLLAGPYQMHNERKVLGFISSHSDVNGWMCCPHFELRRPVAYGCSAKIFDPYVMVDWANDWRGEVTEYGDFGFNIRLDSHYRSILRTEVGLRLSQAYSYCSGDLILVEKAGFVNKAPFGGTSSSTFFEGAISRFGIQVYNDQIMNNGLLQLSLQYIPYCERAPYCSFNYQGEFGNSTHSHLLAFECGKRF